MSDITVLTGGSTPERHVALAGAAQVVDALRSRGHRVTVVDISTGALTPEREGEVLQSSVGKRPPSEAELAALAEAERLPELVELEEVRRSEVLFLVLHGRQGEGGELQALLDLVGLEYVGSDAMGSALAMDKDISKRLFLHAGVPTPDWRLWPVDSADLEALGLPLVVKPSRVGSTVGLSVVRVPREIEEAVTLAAEFDSEVLVEAFVGGRELTVGILGDEALAVGEIVPETGDIFDYESKYTPGLAREIFPADIEPELEDQLRQYALDAHRALKLRDFSRVDFRLDIAGGIFCLEANTIPGMTATSLLPQSAAAVGIDFPELCERIVNQALRRRTVAVSSVGRSA